MAEAVDSVVDVSNLLYPELLSREELIQILLSRCVRKQLIEGLEKYKLVDLFHRIILPLPQRTYSDNRRGKLLNAKRKKSERNKISDENKTNAGNSIKPSSNSKLQVQSPCEEPASGKSRDSLDHIIINDRRKRHKVDEKGQHTPVEVPKISNSESKSSSVIKLKRPITTSELPSTKPEEGEEDKKKKRRIVWP